MKQFLMIILLIISSFAHSGVGGVGGGILMAEKYTEIRVCEGGEQEGPHAICKTIRLKTSKYLEQMAAVQKGGVTECYRMHGEAEVSVPCDEEIKYKIPKFLEKFNEAFNTHTGPLDHPSP